MTTDNDRLRELASGENQPVVEAPSLVRDLRSLLVFRVGPRLFGAGAPQVFEVVVSGSITPLPNARPHVLGITLIRGRLVPVISLRELLGLHAVDESAPTLPRLLVLRDAALEVAVMSDATLGLFDVDTTDLGSSNGGRPDCIAGELEFRGELLSMLAVAALVRSLSAEPRMQ